MNPPYLTRSHVGRDVLLILCNAPPEHLDTDKEGGQKGVASQVLRFTGHSQVVLFGKRGFDTSGGTDSDDSSSESVGSTEQRARSYESHDDAVANFDSDALAKCMDTAVTGLLLCRPASICAWLGVEFCRQSPTIDYVSWAGCVLDSLALADCHSVRVAAVPTSTYS